MLISGFFNAEQIGADENGILYDRVYQAEFFSKYFSSFISNGIFIKEPNQLQVEQNTGMTLKIKGGRAFINGYFCYSDEDFNITLEPSDPLENRIDRIVLQFNLLERDIQAKILKGEPSPTPRPKDITRNENIYELALADITVNTGVTEITNANIKDLRLNNSLCGVSTHILDKIDTTGIYNQIQGDLTEFKEVNEENFNLWFEDLKSKLDENAIQTHINGSIFDTNGIHNLRYNEEKRKFEGFKDDSREWIDLKGLGAGEITLSTTNKIKLIDSPKLIKINWEDAKDSIINDIPLKKWKGTILVRKEGSPPMDYDDGTILLNNTERDKYLNTPFIDEDIEAGKVYYYGLFPYDDEEIYNLSFRNIVRTRKQTVEEGIYSFIVDTNKSNPLEVVTYADDSEIYTTPESWDNSPLFKSIRPCVLKNGIVQYYLNPLNYELKENGEPSILTGEDGDVMVEFPSLFYKIEQIEEGKYKITIVGDYNKYLKDYNYTKMHLQYDNKIYGKKIYHSAYLCSLKDNTLNSVINAEFSYIYLTEIVEKLKQKNDTSFIATTYTFNLILLLTMLRFKTTDLATLFNLETYEKINDIDLLRYKLGRLTKGGLFSGCGSEKPQEAVKVCGIEFFCNGYVSTNQYKTQTYMGCIQSNGIPDGDNDLFLLPQYLVNTKGIKAFESNDRILHYFNRDNRRDGLFTYYNDFLINTDVGFFPVRNYKKPEGTSSTYLTLQAQKKHDDYRAGIHFIYYNFFAKNDGGFNIRPASPYGTYDYSLNGKFSNYYIYIPKNENEEA